MKTLWLFGPSGAGKTTIGTLLVNDIRAYGHRASIIDGDELRKTVCADLGFCHKDRMIQAERAAYMAKSVNDVGAWAVVCLITPFQEARDEVFKILGPNVQMVYLKSPMECRIKRDPKGLYAKAIAGDLCAPLTGYDGRFDEPDPQTITVNTNGSTPQDAANEIISLMLPQFNYGGGI